MMRRVILSTLAIAGVALAAGTGFAELQQGPTGDRQLRQETAPPTEGQQPAEMQPGPARQYVVQEGDTLAGIAERFLGSRKRWKQIAAANGIQDPENLKVGQRLQIPGAKQGFDPGHSLPRS